MKNLFYVYIICNWKKNVLYTGVTNDLKSRIIEHYLNRKEKATFAGRYHCHFLLYYETHQYINNAIARETEIKGWIRDKKIELIKTINPEMKFLNEELFGKWPPKPEELLYRKHFFKRT